MTLSPAAADREAPVWEEDALVRETMLIYLETEEDRAALRRFAALVYDLVLESRRPCPEDYGLETELRAVGAELRYVRGFLEALGRRPEEAAIGLADRRLAGFSALLARRIDPLIAAIESRLKRRRDAGAEAR